MLNLLMNYKNLFCSLFLSDNLKWKKIEDVFDEKWNQSTIINLVNKHGFSFEEAKELFLHMWLYSNGLATLIATNQIKLDEEKIMIRLVKIYKNLVNKILYCIIFVEVKKKLLIGILCALSLSMLNVKAAEETPKETPKEKNQCLCIY